MPDKFAFAEIGKFLGLSPDWCSAETNCAIRTRSESKTRQVHLGAAAFVSLLLIPFSGVVSGEESSFYGAS